MSDITNAIKQICEEKGLSYDAVIATIESALAAAYRKDYGEKNQNIKVEYDPTVNSSKVYDIKTVVEDVPEEELAALEEEAVIEAPVKKVLAGKHIQAEGPASASSTDEASVGEEEKKRFNPKTEIQISDAKKINKKYKIGDEVRTELELHEEYGRMAAQTAKQVIIQRLREAGPIKKIFI
jgi:N utilization substance protein A